MNVLYEDNHIIAVNKAAGEIVQGDKTGDKTLCDKICRALGAEPIQCIGRKIVIYREKPEDEQ